MSETAVPAEQTEIIFSGQERRELTPEVIGALMSRINPTRVASRNQSGANLSYVEAWDIKATLIRFFGFGGFSAEVLDSKIIQIREHATTHQHVKRDGTAATPQIIAQSTVRLTIFGIGPRGEDAVYTETAIGANSGFDIGETADNAIKTASSDALKRCAIYLGTQFGLSLYDKGSRDDVVKTLLDPEQRAMHEAYKASIDAQREQFDETAEANFGRALGATRVEQAEEPVAQEVTA